MLFDILAKQNLTRPDETAIIGESRSLTYQQLFTEVQNTALSLQALGLDCGCNLVVGIPPNPDFYILFYAAAALGATVVPVIDSGKLAPQVKDLKSVWLAGTTRFIEDMRRNGLNAAGNIPWDRRAGLRLPRGDKQFGHRKRIRHEHVLAISTSGTTGKPVLHTRSAQVLPQRARLRASSWNITPSDTLICLAPFTNGANADFHLILPIVIGCKVVVLERFQRRNVIEAIAQHRVTVIFSVPLTFEILANVPAETAPDLTSVRCCISAGAYLPKSVYWNFHRRYRLGIGQMYGGSHISPVFTFNHGHAPEAVGQRHGPFPVNVVDDRGRPLPAGKIGEIVFEYDAIQDKVLRQSLKDNPYRKNRFIHTGDLGRFDGADNLFVVGRKSSFIKVGGSRVIPAEIEEVLRQHPNVREAIVVPLNPGTTEEAVGAVVVRDGTVTATQLMDHCAQSLEAFKCPKKISFRKSLPRNQHGKIIRYQITV